MGYIRGFIRGLHITLACPDCLVPPRVRDRTGINRVSGQETGLFCPVTNLKDNKYPHTLRNVYPLSLAFV